MYVCVSGVKKYSFFGKFGVLCFLVTSVLRFAHLYYYRRFIKILSEKKNKEITNWMYAALISGMSGCNLNEVGAGVFCIADNNPAVVSVLSCLSFCLLCNINFSCNCFSPLMIWHRIVKIRSASVLFSLLMITSYFQSNVTASNAC